MISPRKLHHDDDRDDFSAPIASAGSALAYLAIVAVVTAITVYSEMQKYERNTHSDTFDIFILVWFLSWPSSSVTSDLVPAKPEEMDRGYLLERAGAFMAGATVQAFVVFLIIWLIIEVVRRLR